MSLLSNSERESQTRMMIAFEIGRAKFRRASSRALTQPSNHFTGVLYFGQTAPFQSAAFYDPVFLLVPSLAFLAVFLPYLYCTLPNHVRMSFVPGMCRILAVPTEKRFPANQAGYA
jgi:hypothetical protein